MSEYRRLTTLHQEVSSNAQLGTTGTGVTLVTAAKSAKETIFVQKVHIEVTTGASGTTWSFQGDATGVNLIPNVSAAAIAHFDFDFGPQGMPLTQGKNFVLVANQSGAAGNITWEAYQKPTAVMSITDASI